MADLTMVLLAIRVPQQCCSALELDQQNAQSHYIVPQRRRYHRRVAIIGQGLSNRSRKMSVATNSTFTPPPHEWPANHTDCARLTCQVMSRPARDVQSCSLVSKDRRRERFCGSGFPKSDRHGMKDTVPALQ